MPFETADIAGARSDVAAPPEPPSNKGIGDVAIAAFRQDNTVVSTISAALNSGNFTPDPNHNPLDVIKGTPYEARNLDAFVGSRSEGETRSIMRRIDQEDADRKVLEGAGVGGTMLSMLAGTLDPTIALPGGVAMKASKEGYTAVRSGAAVGAAVAGQVAAQETILHATQETRTAGESALNIASATLLGSLLGAGASRLLGPAERTALTEALDHERAKMDAHAAGLPDVPPVGTSAIEKVLASENLPVGGETKIGFGSASMRAYREQLAAKETGHPSPVTLTPNRVVGENTHVLDILDADKKPIGSARFKIEGAKATLEDINVTGSANSLGPAAARSMLQQFRELHPEVKEITGTRTTGARAAASDNFAGQDVSISFQPGAAGAAATDTRKLELVPAFGVEKVTAGFDPMSRLLNAESVAARRAAVDLAETPLLFKENAAGIATTAGPALERAAKMAITQTRVAVSDELDRLFSEYRFGSADKSMPRLRAQFEQFRGRGDGYMTYDAFKKEISLALQQGDKHDIPQVQAAAQFVRDRVFNPWKDRAISAGLLPEGVDTKTAESYFQRVYNKQAIAAQRPEFVNTVQSWLKSDQATKARAKDRLVGYARELEAIQKKIERLAADPAKAGELADATLAHDAIRAKIEEEIAGWQGKSVAEARSLIKARERYAVETERELGAARLRSADNAVDAAVKRIIESDRDLTDAELRDRAHEITERVLGSADGRLPYDIAQGGPEIGYSAAGQPPRGPLAAREFNIPDELIRPWLEQDVEHVINTHLRTMVPDVMLTEKFGDVRMTEAFKKIEDDYAALIDATKSEKDRTRLGKERDVALRDLAAVRDRVRGVYGLDVFNSMRGVARTVAAVKNYNVISSMGMATVSSLPDMAGAVFRHGLSSAFHDAWAPFARYMMGGSDAWKEAAGQFRAMGIATEMTLAQRAHALSDVTESYRPQSRVERTLQWGADKFQLVNLLAPWTDFGKINASMIAGSEILKASKAMAEGGGNARQLRGLAENGIDRAMAERIHQAFQAGGEVRDGVHLPNTGDWTDHAARQAFEGAVSREADIAIVTPGQEKPLWLSNPVISAIGQFKSFTAASTQRILLANLQRSDAQTLQGLIFSLGLGMMSYKINGMFGGQPTSDRPQDWVKESISRGGLLGWFEEGNALASKMTRGGVDVYRMIGSDKPLSRYASRSVLDQLLGPTAGKIENVAKITGAAASRDWDASDTRALRRLTAFQNLFYLRGLLNQVEAAGNHSLGIPEKPPTKH